MSDLNFDNIVEVDTNLAKIHFQKISSDIHSLGLENLEEGNYDHDNCHNKLYLVDYKKAIDKVVQTPSKNTVVAVEMYIRLTRKVEANAELFAQLEYMTRKVPVSETKNCHIKLIVQNLLYWSTQVGQYVQLEEVEQIIMNEKTPLSSLGCLAPLLCISKSCVIESTKETAAVCHLLTQLCHEVGLKNVYLLLVQHTTNIKELRINEAIDLYSMERLQRGGAAIVTGRADIDSAVDAFLTSTTMFPWHIRRLLVQENVYESFKKAISWKASLKQSGDHNCQAILDRYASKCTDSFIYDEKVFLLNYVGSSEDLQEIAKCAIIVEAYRTTKELLTLIKQYQPHCLSVWSSDIAEANEIAFGVETSIIWINDINNFDGPPQSSQAFYSNVLLHHRIEKLNETEDTKNFIKLKNNWLKLDSNERRELIFKAIENCCFNDNLMDFARQLQLSISKDSNKFIEIEGSRMCIGIQEPVGAIATIVMSTNKLIDVIKSSIFGNGVIIAFDPDWIETNNYGNLSKIIELLIKVDVPIILVSDNFTYGDFLEFKNPYMMYKTRVIWTNFGTIFAN